MMPNALGNVKGRCVVLCGLALWSARRLNGENPGAKPCSWVAAELRAAGTQL